MTRFPAPASVLPVHVARFWAFVGLVVLLAPSVTRATAPPRWDAPFMEATSEVVARAAAALPAREAMQVLSTGIEIRVAADGREVETTRSVLRFNNEEAARVFGVLRFTWTPTDERRPLMRARTTTPDGRTLVLDGSGLIDAPGDRSEGVGVVSDARGLTVVLPGVVKGAVVELEIIRERVASMFPVLDRSLPLEAEDTGVPVRVTVDLPAGLEARAGFDGRGVRHTLERRADGVRHVFETTPDAGGGTRAEAATPTLGVLSAWPSHAAVARWYSDLADRQIAAGPPPAALTADLPQAAPQGRNALEVLRALYARLAPRVRYVTIAVGARRIEPTPPAATYERGVADCKAMALLVVSALRRLGFEAHVVLLAADGPDAADVPLDVPTAALFNHAIVAVRQGTGFLFVDPTVPDLPPEFLPRHDYGRRVLVAAASTRALTTTPAFAPAENVIRLTLDAQFTADGEVTRTTRWTGRGLAAANLIRSARAQGTETTLEPDGLGGVEISKETTHGPLPDPDAPRFDGQVLGFADVVAAARQSVTAPAGAPAPAPLRVESEETYTPPPGFVPASLPTDLHAREAGLELTRTTTVEAGGRVRVRSLLIRTTAPASAEAVERFVALVRAQSQRPEANGDQIAFTTSARALMVAGRVREAAAAAQAARAGTPGSRAGERRYGLFLNELGFRDAALAVVDQAAARMPEDVDLQLVRATVLAADPLGRDWLPSMLPSGAAVVSAAGVLARLRAEHPTLATESWEAHLRLYDAHGVRLGREADLRAAIDLFDRVEVGSLTGHKAELYGAALLLVGDVDRLVTLARARPEAAGAAVSAVAEARGLEAALRLAKDPSAVGGAPWREVLERATEFASRRGRFEAAETFARAACGGDASCTEAQDELVRLQSHRLAASAALGSWKPDEPRRLAFELLRLAPDVAPDSKAVRALFGGPLSKEEGARLRELLQAMGRGRRVFALDSEAFLDAEVVRRRLVDARVEGACPGAVRLLAPKQTPLFFRCEGGRPVLSLANLAPHHFGLEVLAALERDDLETARTWARFGVDPRGTGEVPSIIGRPIPALSLEDAASADRPLLALAAAVPLANAVDDDSAIAVRASTWAKGAVATGPARTLRALDAALRARGEAKVARLASLRRLHTEDSTLGVWELEIIAMVRGGAAAVEHARQALQAPGLTPLTRMSLATSAAKLAARDGLWKDRLSMWTIVDAAANGRNSTALNEIAWQRLLEEGPTDEVLGLSRRLTQGGRAATAAEYNTLATALAEAGRATEAMETLRDDVRAHGRLLASDDFVLGRIAETWGLPAVARFYYERIATSEKTGPLEVASLARRRLSGLDAIESTAKR
jgi:tetratricopeptide (TPR) repeat protein